MSRRRRAHAARPTPGMVRLRRLTALAIAGIAVVGALYLVDGRDGSKSAQHVENVSTTTSQPALPPPSSAPPATADPNQTFTISAVGDTMLGKDGNGPPNPSTYLSDVSDDLRRDAHIVFGNLEGTLSDVSGSKCAPDSTNCFAFQVPPSYAKYLADAGFTVLNTANNHSHDFGEAGLKQTVDAIRGAGMVDTGQHNQITVVNAGPVRVAFVGFAPYAETSSMLDAVAARDLLRRARQQSDVVVAYMHGGAEGKDAQHVTGDEETYVGEDRGNPQAFAHMAIDEGASLVLASGPHVLRGMEFYKGHLIAYSLGNFAGYSNFNTNGILSNSAILRVTLNGAGEFVGGQVLPVALSSQNQPSSGGEAVAMINRLSSADFADAAPKFAGDGTFSRPT